MNPEQGGESEDKMSKGRFQDMLISMGQTKLSDELEDLAREMDKDKYNTLFYDYTELRMHEFRIRISANILHEKIKETNDKIEKLDRLDIDLQKELQNERDQMQVYLDEYDDTLTSLADGIEVMEEENKFNQEFLEFKEMIEDKEGRMLEQAMGPEDVSLN